MSSVGGGGGTYVYTFNREVVFIFVCVNGRLQSFFAMPTKFYPTHPPTASIKEQLP